ncbi:geranylgeranyl reductase family [Hymenobacter gelipurpurascens]|uniref:Geranylgeranyl reductase family n=1 Tax=Hymenobacter gelipurpurascens TaxID=89968 RepID=A0A212U9V5_9BACT|nr:NAD(P)/FAD-dependent oxidoreductase [Hymenobacter gelipurpurascens]SNC74986.1 geranylgeranyl reductase family [Hymenobacter gelipurpurascens]
MALRYLWRLANLPARVPDSVITDYDVLLVGAGPAGTACALALRRSGLRVALVDKAQFPRDKICGDAIPSPTLKALAGLDVAYAAELRVLLASHRADVAHSRLVAPGGAEVSISWKAPAFNSPRLQFDEALLKLVRRHTTTTVLENWPVKTVEACSSHVTLHSANHAQPPLTARLVIGCDGANSVVGRHLAPWPLDRSRHCAAVRAYYSGVTNAPETTSDFYFLRQHLAGYCWVFPVGNGVYNVGFGMLSSDIARDQIDLKAVLRELLAEHPALAPQFREARPLSEIKGFGLPLGGSARPLTGPRALLCGDAAALIDPMQGHGIDKAVQSGLLAAEHALRCFQQNDFSAASLHQYQAEVQRRIGRPLGQRYRLMRFLSGQPWLVNSVVRVARWPWIRQALVRNFG